MAVFVRDERRCLYGVLCDSLQSSLNGIQGLSTSSLSHTFYAHSRKLTVLKPIYNRAIFPFTSSTFLIEAVHTRSIKAFSYDSKNILASPFYAYPRKLPILQANRPIVPFFHPPPVHFTSKSFVVKVLQRFRRRDNRGNNKDSCRKQRGTRQPVSRDGEDL